MKRPGLPVSSPQQRRPGQPGLPALHQALAAAAQAITLERSLRSRAELREQQSRLLRRRAPGGAREAIDTEAEELRRLMLKNSSILTTALAASQAINETLPEPLDIDAALMAALSARSQIHGR